MSMLPYVVPYVKGHGYAADRGYLPIYEIGARADVNVAQLLLNVSFAALIGALVSNLSRRGWRRLFWIVASGALLIAAWFGFVAFQDRMKSGAENEEAIARLQIENGNFHAAKEHLLKASNYWWWKGWWDGARNARERASGDEGMKKEAAVFRAHKDEERAKPLLRMTNVFDQFDSKASEEAFLDAPYPSDNKVTEAKRLLLDAAEKWHVAGNTAEEERVRAWEKNIKTEAELRASLPDQPPNKYMSTDPYAWLREAESRREWDAEEAQCRAPLRYPSVKWDHQTEFG
jgi:hypothetical protein